jgi:hypothetical protein
MVRVTKRMREGEIRQRMPLIEFCSNLANHPEKTSRRKSGRGIRQSLSNQSVGRCRPVNHGCYLPGLAGQSSERTQVEWIQWNLSENEWSMGGNEHITLVFVMRSSRETVAGTFRRFAQRAVVGPMAHVQASKLHISSTFKA